MEGLLVFLEHRWVRFAQCPKIYDPSLDTRTHIVDFGSLVLRVLYRLGEPVDNLQGAGCFPERECETIFTV